MNINTILDLTRIIIKANFVDKNLLPTKEIITDSLNDMCQKFDISLTADLLKSKVDILSLNFSVEIEGASPVLSDNKDHLEWLPQNRGDIKWKFWNRYEKYLLQDKGLPEKSVKSINRTTDQVLSLLENPSRAGTWDRRGLVVGSVQSGKTGNYTGLICKAADAGYKVIVVLAGIHNDLRAQSQLRLDEGFLGYETNIDGDGPRKRIGVGYIDPTPKVNTITNRSENGDFQRSAASQFNIEPDQIPLLFVVKKNKSILDNLNSWVSTFADPGSKKVKDTSILVIDDEADQASVDTAEDDPSTINKLIRKLLSSFEKSAYVGYTATPFANVLISDSKDHQNHGEDLFPKSFILSLPVPSNYVGPHKIFSADADQDYPIIKSLSSDIDDSSQWVSKTHKKDLIPTYHGVERIPPCLERAIFSFLLSVSARTIRGDENKHNSMLIHVTRFKDVQLQVAAQVMDCIDDIRAKINHEGDKEDSILSKLNKLWNDDYIPTTEAIRGNVDIQWGCIKKEIISTLDKLEVKTINGSSKDGLDYLREDFPECVIAIGGDKLSRGLTLEGLSVSYFLRQSKMYDTLMQMGRWFGYRPRYDDLCRLFTNTSMVSNFQSILMASEELVEELNEMSELGMTPKDFGLKVKVHPGLLVTNKMKMRNTREVDVSFASGVAESTAINPRDIEKNWERLNNFLSVCGLNSIQHSKKLNNSYIKRNWSDIFYAHSVKGLNVANFLAEFRTHDSSRAVIPEIIAKYINAQISNNELIDWTVVVHSGTGSKVQLNNDLSIKSSQRKVLSIDDEKITFRRLASKNDEFIDLTDDEIIKKVKIWESRDKTSIKPKDVHSRQIRSKSKGLIMFYIIEPLNEDKEVIQLDYPLVGFMVSFPRSTTAKTVKYRVNNVWIKENMS
jgi:hypothetical protein